MSIILFFLSFLLQITRSDIRLCAKRVVSLVIADGHLIFLWGWGAIYGLTYALWLNILTITPEGYMTVLNPNKKLTICNRSGLKDIFEQSRSKAQCFLSSI